MNELSKEEREYLEKQLEVLMSNWRLLDTQRAGFGPLHVPLPLMNQLSATEKEINEISIRLGLPSPLERLKPEVQSDGKRDERQSQKEKSEIQQNINIIGSQGVTITQVGGNLNNSFSSQEKRPVSELLDKLAKTEG